jgi:hypothetical protein
MATAHTVATKTSHPTIAAALVWLALSVTSQRGRHVLNILSAGAERLWHWGRRTGTKLALLEPALELNCFPESRLSRLPSAPSLSCHGLKDVSGTDSGARKRIY